MGLVSLPWSTLFGGLCPQSLRPGSTRTATDRLHHILDAARVPLANGASVLQDTSAD